MEHDASSGEESFDHQRSDVSCHHNIREFDGFRFKRPTRTALFPERKVQYLSNRQLHVYSWRHLTHLLQYVRGVDVWFSY